MTLKMTSRRNACAEIETGNSTTRHFFYVYIDTTKRSVTNKKRIKATGTQQFDSAGNFSQIDQDPFQLILFMVERYYFSETLCSVIPVPK